MTSPDALPALTEQLYQEMRHCARRLLASRPGQMTLQTTDVVHEACIRLMESPTRYQDKAHLYRSAAKAMRHLLIDHARAKATQKRSAQKLRTIWIDDLLGDIDINLGLLTIDKALTEMSGISERLETIAELHYLAGFTQTQIADILSLGLATVERELKFARSFLTDRLQQNHA